MKPQALVQFNRSCNSSCRSLFLKLYGNDSIWIPHKFGDEQSIDLLKLSKERHENNFRRCQREIWFLIRMVAINLFVSFYCRAKFSICCMATENACFREVSEEQKTILLRFYSGISLRLLAKLALGDILAIFDALFRVRCHPILAWQVLSCRRNSRITNIETIRKNIFGKGHPTATQIFLYFRGKPGKKNGCKRISWKMTKTSNSFRHCGLLYCLASWMPSLSYKCTRLKRKFVFLSAVGNWKTKERWVWLRASCRAHRLDLVIVIKQNPKHNFHFRRQAFGSTFFHIPHFSSSVFSPRPHHHHHHHLSHIFLLFVRQLSPILSNRLERILFGRMRHERWKVHSPTTYPVHRATILLCANA